LRNIFTLRNQQLVALEYPSSKHDKVAIFYIKNILTNLLKNRISNLTRDFSFQLFGNFISTYVIIILSEHFLIFYNISSTKI